MYECNLIELQPLYVKCNTSELEKLLDIVLKSNFSFKFSQRYLQQSVHHDLFSLFNCRVIFTVPNPIDPFMPSSLP